MLVVTRREKEVVKIGDDIEIKVLKQGDGYVRLGIEAPKDVVVIRKELFIAQKENIRASEAISKSVVEQLKQQNDLKLKRGD
jgi:carbon storage regulator